jgi:hypothetical protein
MSQALNAADHDEVDDIADTGLDPDTVHDLDLLGSSGTRCTRSDPPQ